MLITCWSVKGGSGTTVVAATLALLAAEGGAPTWLVDAAGDTPAALGLPEPPGPGLGDWLASPPSVGPDALSRLVIPAGPGVSLLPQGEPPGRSNTRWAALVDALHRQPGVVVMDLGTGAVPDVARASAQHDVLVVRGCYLALRRAAALARPPSTVVLVAEPGRSLGARDVEHVTGARVVTVDWDPAVSRSVDAGLLASRVPRSLRRPLSGFGWEGS